MKFLKALFRNKKTHTSKQIDQIRPKETQPDRIMHDIYLNKKWGGKKRDYYSGFGSHSRKVVKPYVKAVRSFLDVHQNKFVVCDIGCGDFNVGSQLVDSTSLYKAVDIVEELIVRNRKLFINEKLTFNSVDIINGKLPDGDCALIRQVLQHLSNDDIKNVLPKLQKFKYVIVTEHLPKKEFAPNIDKVTGASIRLSKGSGVVLHEAPFNLNVKNRAELVRKHYNKGVIVTTLYTM